MRLKILHSRKFSKHVTNLRLRLWAPTLNISLRKENWLDDFVTRSKYFPVKSSFFHFETIEDKFALMATQRCSTFVTVPYNRVFSHDVTAAILVSQNNETAAMLVSQISPLGVELFSYVNAFFCSNKFAYMLATWVKSLYRYRIQCKATWYNKLNTNNIYIYKTVFQK